MSIKIYGIKNCDTMKKALKWLDEHNMTYHFHDYKKEGAPEDILKQAISEHGWEKVINRRGTTWRQLPDVVKSEMDENKALKIAQETPSIIKRPILLKDKQTYLGFSADDYTALFK